MREAAEDTICSMRQCKFKKSYDDVDMRGVENWAVNC